MVPSSAGAAVGGLVPLIQRGQEIVGVFMSVLVAPAVLPGSPERDVVIGSAGREIVGRLVPLS